MLKNGYLENYFLGVQDQLEKRIAIGDVQFWKDLKGEDKELMKKIVKDIQKSLLEHNDFVRFFRSYKESVDQQLDLAVQQGEQEFVNNLTREKSNLLTSVPTTAVQRSSLRYWFKTMNVTVLFP